MRTIKRAVIAAGLVLAGIGAAWAEDPVGRWTGVLTVPNAQLPVAITITKGADGKLAGVAENKAQVPDPIPVDTVTSDGKALAFTIASLQGSYSAVWNEELKSWTGSWKQGDQTYPLVLIRAQ